MEKVCTKCTKNFTCTQQEKDILKKLSPIFERQTYSLPLPTLCPACRQERRLATRNEDVLYQRKCDKCKKEMISIYTKNTLFPVYCASCWWSDTWDPTSLGLEFDTHESFFSQIQNLKNSIPRLGLINKQNENSEYTNYTAHNKNCYLLFNGEHNEDCYYCYSLDRSKNCMDMYWSGSCELSYGLISCHAAYHSQFCSHSENLSDCFFCYDCEDCHECFGCYGLNHKKYHFFNQPHTKEEYLKKMKDIVAKKKTHTGLMELTREVENFFQKCPHRYAMIFGCENSTGNFLVHCDTCTDCYSVTRSQDCAYLYDVSDIRDSMDCTFGGMENSQLMYEVQDCWYGYQVLFSVSCWNCHDLYYSDSCFNCNNCFGCIGLREKGYCILNRQYMKEEYEALLPKIIAHMRRSSLTLHAENGSHPSDTSLSKEWGEFFPAELSPFDYEDSAAHTAYTLSASETQNTFTWPENIDDVPDSIVRKILTCIECHKPYRVLPQELAFYRQHQLPIPRTCARTRQHYREREAMNRKLWPRKCEQCQKEIFSIFSPDRTGKILCARCYIETIE